MGGKIPATIVTGFLGAGKTTLIRGLIERARGRKLALVINEFGDLAVDGDLLRGCGNPRCTDEDIFELANGCICCTVADDFLPTVRAILDRPEPPDHIVIETSGLALPGPLVQAFDWPEVRTRVAVDGVVAVIDGPAVAEGRFADDPERALRTADPAMEHENPLQELYEDQLSCADLVLLNKADLMTADAMQSVSGQVRGNVREGARVIPTANGAIDAEILLGIAAADSRPAAAPHDEHDHDEFESFHLVLPEIAAPEELGRRLRSVLAEHDVLRVKGFASVAGKEMRLVVQGVGARIRHYYDRPWKAAEPRETRLVIIGMAELDRNAIAATLGN